MTKMTVLMMVAGLALAGCKKKDGGGEAGSGTAAGSGVASGSGAASGSGSATGSGSAAGSATGSGSGSATAPLAGEALAKAYVGTWAAWTTGDKAAFRAAYAADAVSHWPDNPIPERKGGDAITEAAFAFHAAFPDAKAAPQLVFVNGRTVVGVVLTVGTNSAPMKMGADEMPPTGKKIGQLMFHAATYNDANQVVEDWYVMDGNTMANQLGLSPMPGRPVMDKGADAPTIVVATGSDAEKANLALIDQGIVDFNKHDLAALDAAWAEDAIESDQSAPADVQGRATIGEGTKMFLGAFPDGKVEKKLAFTAGDYGVMVSTFAGTNTGDMGPMKATGKPVAITVAEVNQYAGGKYKHVWRFFNSAGMAMQLGMMPDADEPKGDPKLH